MRGGSRPGAGRKPGTKNFRSVVLDMDGARRPKAELPTPTDPPVAVEAGQDSPLLDPPDDLSERERACWRKFAGRAIRQRTLTDAEVPGFLELCQVFVMKEQVAAHIAQAGGAASEDVDGLLRHYVKLGQRVDALLARFKLTAFGKPSDAAAAKPVKSNPWASMAK